MTPNDHYSGRTAPLTSKRCILYIYSTNIGTEYFKYGIYSPFFSLQNAVCFIILKYLVPVLFTFYIQGVIKFKNIYNSGAKSLTTYSTVPFRQPSGLKNKSAPAHFMGLLNSNPDGGIDFWSLADVVWCQGEVSATGRVNLLEESYKVWCVWVWSRNVLYEALAHCWAIRKKYTTYRDSYTWGQPYRSRQPSGPWE